MRNGKEIPAPQLRIDVAFAATTAGPPLPVDHGYALFASLCRLLGNLHGVDWLAVHSLAGVSVGEGELTLRPRTAALRLRVQPAHLGDVLPLAGKNLQVAGTQIQLGTSRLYTIQPASRLASRLVTIKGYVDEKPFEERVKAQLVSQQIAARVTVGRRRIVTVDGDKVVGFGLLLEGLSDADSLALQYEGLGGRQRLGCGIFGPATRGATS
jgi:CRISPR-associated endonuclease/helicase Cas3